MVGYPMTSLSVTIQMITEWCQNFCYGAAFFPLSQKKIPKRLYVMYVKYVDIFRGEHAATESQNYVTPSNNCLS